MIAQWRQAGSEDAHTARRSAKCLRSRALHQAPRRCVGACTLFYSVRRRASQRAMFNAIVNTLFDDTQSLVMSGRARGTIRARTTSAAPVRRRVLPTLQTEAGPPCARETAPRSHLRRQRQRLARVSRCRSYRERSFVPFTATPHGGTRTYTDTCARAFTSTPSPLSCVSAAVCCRTDKLQTDVHVHSRKDCQMYVKGCVCFGNGNARSLALAFALKL
jgi:hypothetical protein